MKGGVIMKNKEKLENLENKIYDELKEINDPEMLRKKLEVLLQITQIKRLSEEKR